MVEIYTNKYGITFFLSDTMKRVIAEEVTKIMESKPTRSRACLLSKVVM